MGATTAASPEGEPLAGPRFASVTKRIAVTNLQMLLDGLGAMPACLVTVESTQGSVPREPGAWMAVFADQLVGKYRHPSAGLPGHGPLGRLHGHQTGWRGPQAVQQHLQICQRDPFRDGRETGPCQRLTVR